MKKDKNSTLTSKKNQLKVRILEIKEDKIDDKGFTIAI